MTPGENASREDGRDASWLGRIDGTIAGKSGRALQTIGQRSHFAEQAEEGEHTRHNDNYLLEGTHWAYRFEPLRKIRVGDPPELFLRYGHNDKLVTLSKMACR
jgi:hypothetical protein